MNQLPYATAHASRKIFERGTDERLQKLLERSDTHPASISESDLQWVSGLVRDKKITSISRGIEFQYCGLILGNRQNVPESLRGDYKTIGLEMIKYRGDDHHMIALAGCIVLSRLKDPSLIPTMKTLLSNPDKDYRDRVNRAIADAK